MIKEQLIKEILNSSELKETVENANMFYVDYNFLKILQLSFLIVFSFSICRAIFELIKNIIKKGKDVETAFNDSLYYFILPVVVIPFFIFFRSDFILNKSLIYHQSQEKVYLLCAENIRKKYSPEGDAEVEVGELFAQAAKSRSICTLIENELNARQKKRLKKQIKEDLSSLNSY